MTVRFKRTGDVLQNGKRGESLPLKAFEAEVIFSAWCCNKDESGITGKSVTEAGSTFNQHEGLKANLIGFIGLPI